MDAKDLRAEAALTERSDDGGKFAPQYGRSKGQDVGASVFKGDLATARPCAVIGPDRVLPPARECPKKAPPEPWLASDPVYRRLNEYPHKMSDHKDPTRNISPRQTFQENMQRIIMPPGYNAVKLHEDPQYASKSNKLNVPLEVKYCEVPYNINPISSDQKHIRNTDHSSSNMNPLIMRGVPHGWPPSSVNIRPLRPYGSPDVLQYPDYGNYTGPRPVLTRTHSSGQDELQQLYSDQYYHESNVRFKPYHNIKERYPQARYEYLGNYPNPYHPTHPFPHKYELPKTMPPHTYSGYPPVPIKYTERVSEPVIDGYQRAFSQPGNYNVPIRNPVIHPPYRPSPANQMHNKLHPYPPDGQHKSPVSNKLPYDPSSKMYIDYDTHSKTLPLTDNYYLNELPRSYPAKNTIVLPNYAPAGMHGVNTHPYYIKQNMPLKNYELHTHRFKNMDPSMINHSLTKMPPQFSPSTLAISPADSNASIETAQTHGTSQEDCGYVSQSSMTSVRSIESLNRIPMDLYGRYDYRYSPVVRSSPTSKQDPNNQGSKSNKDIRQFISSWSEGDDEIAESGAKRDSIKTISDGKHTFNKQCEVANNQEQLYVLGLVNVPSEELGKYEHIQKVSKLPENIKGYNSLELLNQFEEAIESSNISSIKPPTPRAIQMPIKSMPHKQDSIPRAVSPLDVEAKISQSVIHKDVGCNFEIKPCSPKMLNVEVATPMQTLLSERVIEKVANPHTIKSPVVLQGMDENIGSSLINKSTKCPIPNTASSCKMINSNHLAESSAVDHLKTNYSIQDLESNSGVCLASLPRLDTDIELNFPEVNQQFINANKTESVITASFSNDLPTLDVDGSSTSKNTGSSSEYDLNYQFSPKMEAETDFSRLSKYRKLKRTLPNDNETALSKAQATRVNSVIIKNPDNTRGIEDNTDTSISGGNNRNNFQEFAMNLVSQAKNSRVNHQHEANKIYDTPTNNTSLSKCDEISINSPNNAPRSKSENLVNKSFKVMEDASRNNALHGQSDDLSVHNKELSNRYLETALDMPMNLSPQAKYSMIGADDEIRNNRANDKNKYQDRLAIENICHNKNSRETPLYTSNHSLDDTTDMLIDSRDKYLMNITCYDICEKPISEMNNSGSCLSLDCNKKQHDTERDKNVIDENDHTVSQIDKLQASPMIKTYYDEGAVKKHIRGLNADESIGKSEKDTERMNYTFDDKEEVTGNESMTVDVLDALPREHDITSESGRKKRENKYVSKLKRKRNKTEGTHRKLGTERKREKTALDGNLIINEQEKLLKSSDSEKDNSVRQSDNEVPEILSANVTSEEKKYSETSLSESCNDHFKNNTSSLNLENIENTLYKENNIHINEKICIKSPNASDKVIKCVTSRRENTISQNDFSPHVDTKNIFPRTTTSTLNDLPINAPVISSIINNDDVSEIILPLSTHAIIDIEEKQIITPLCLDQHEKRIKVETTNQDTECEKKESNTAVLSDQEVKQEEEKLTSADNYCEEKESDTTILSDEDGSQNKEKNTVVSIDCDDKELKTPKLLDQKENERWEKQFEFTISKNEDRNQNINVQNTNDMKNGFSQAIINKKIYTNKTVFHHPYLKKELFSSRFQNLLVFNENYDICPCVSKSKITITKSTPQKTKIATYDYAIQDPKIDTIHEVGKINNSIECIETSDQANMIEKSDFSINIEIHTDKEITTKEPIDRKLFKNVSTDDIPVLNDSNNTENDLKQETEHEVPIDNKQSSSLLDMKSKGYENTNSKAPNDDSLVKGNNDACEDVIIQSMSEKIGNKTDQDFENVHANHDLDSELINNDETYEKNIVVIDETTNKITIPDGNNYEFDKKIQLFSKNTNGRPLFPLKRSLSDSALNAYDDDLNESSEKKCFMLPKRKKNTDMGNIDESQLLNIIQSNRRNSISTLCNENFSFCILIDDNCIVAEENDFIQFDDGSLNPAFKDPEEDEKCNSPVYNTVDQNVINSESYMTKSEEEKAWVEDVACEETIETEDIAENIVIGEPVSPKDTDLSDYESDDENVGILNDAVDHTSKVKHIYGDNMCTNDAQLVDALYRTPQMDVNKKLMDRESQVVEKSPKYYDSDSLEMLLAEPTNKIPDVSAESNTFSRTQGHKKNKEDEIPKFTAVLSPQVRNFNNSLTNLNSLHEDNNQSMENVTEPLTSDKTQGETVEFCESSLDNVLSHIHKDGLYSSSSSPEVSSTTSEEKNSSILLKISNFKVSPTSEVKHITYDKEKENSYKLTKKEYLVPNYTNDMPTNKPLRTKAAQKYIPPLRESVPDLKVKLALPQKSLLKLQKNKAKVEPKSSNGSTYSHTNNVKLNKEIPKKIKPKFEDVLKNIDEVQFQMHKEKHKKTKKYIPKVVIKKSENGSHYASTSTKEFNPDLTGRKWQPWVFIEKNQFIDKMALRNKTRAVFSHRRKSFVLTEKVYRYKSISSAKFVISQPKLDDFATGNLKYTIKLKHTY